MANFPFAFTFSKLILVVAISVPSGEQETYQWQKLQYFHNTCSLLCVAPPICYTDYKITRLWTEKHYNRMNYCFIYDEFVHQVTFIFCVDLMMLYTQHTTPIETEYASVCVSAVIKKQFGWQGCIFFSIFVFCKHDLNICKMLYIF